MRFEFGGVAAGFRRQRGQVVRPALSSGWRAVCSNGAIRRPRGIALMSRNPWICRGSWLSPGRIHSDTKRAARAGASSAWGLSRLVQPSPGHTALAALFYSLMETARLRGEDPGRYLLRAALAAIETPGGVTLRLTPLRRASLPGGLIPAPSSPGAASCYSSLASKCRGMVGRASAKAVSES
jgi:hypothetical protein